MVFEQNYNIKIKVQGKSTMQLEMFEDTLISVVSTYENKSNVKIILSDSKGNKLDRNSNSFSFIPYLNGVPDPDHKKRRES
jgi:hypothetical protein